MLFAYDAAPFAALAPVHQMVWVDARSLQQRVKLKKDACDFCIWDLYFEQLT